MSDELKTNEVCKCEDHQEEVRFTIEIEVFDDGRLNAIQRFPHAKYSEIVSPGGTSSFTRRSYADLLKLGAGIHSICRCNTIGRPGTIHRSKKLE